MINVREVDVFNATALYNLDNFESLSQTICVSLAELEQKQAEIEEEYQHSQRFLEKAIERVHACEVDVEQKESVVEKIEEKIQEAMEKLPTTALLIPPLEAEKAIAISALSVARIRLVNAIRDQEKMEYRLARCEGLVQKNSMFIEELNYKFNYIQESYQSLNTELESRLTLGYERLSRYLAVVQHKDLSTNSNDVKKIKTNVEKNENVLEIDFEAHRFLKDRAECFRIANESLKNHLNSEKIKERFSERQIAQIGLGKTPEGYIWHYDNKLASDRLCLIRFDAYKERGEDFIQ